MLLKFCCCILTILAGVSIIAAANDTEAKTQGPQASKAKLIVTGKDFHGFDPEQAELGRLLFYDPILSGNFNISCGTCHNHDLGTSDALPLGIGEGGRGLGPERQAGVGADRIKKRVPRNALAMWNLGAREIEILFHDGRLSLSDDYGNGFNSPAEEWLPSGLDNILAAQALFPVAAQFEMAGNPKENEVAGAVHDRIDNVWPILAHRVRSNSEYARLFVSAFPGLPSSADITIVHIANAISAFINSEWRSHDSAYDRWLAGDDAALSDSQRLGLDLFFGKGNCSECHSGKFFSDQKFHALGLPHIGPGRTRRFDPMARDVGRMGETDRLSDAYKFRTPMLRNVALTAPYGHNGAYATLAEIIQHHSQPHASLAQWRPEKVSLPSAPWLEVIDFIVLQDQREQQRLRSSIGIQPVALSSTEIKALVAFMHALTGSDASTAGRLGKPEAVPSGLPVD